MAPFRPGRIFSVRLDFRWDGRPFHHSSIKFELCRLIRSKIGTFRARPGGFFSVRFDVPSHGCWSYTIPPNSIVLFWISQKFVVFSSGRLLSIPYLLQWQRSRKLRLAIWDTTTLINLGLCQMTVVRIPLIISAGFPPS